MLYEQIVNAAQSLMARETLGVIYLGKKLKRHPPWEPIALFVMKPVIWLYSLGFYTLNWTSVAS
jgi:hypothetical protein